MHQCCLLATKIYYILGLIGQNITVRCCCCCFLVLLSIVNINRVPWEKFYLKCCCPILKQHCPESDRTKFLVCNNVAIPVTNMSMILSNYDRTYSTKKNFKAIITFHCRRGCCCCHSDHYPEHSGLESLLIIASLQRDNHHSHMMSISFIVLFFS